MSSKIFKVLSTTGILGYGFPEESFNRGISKDPDLIAVDAGSTDPGPYYLGSGKSFVQNDAVKRDLELMLCAAIKHSIPCIIGSAGGSGAKEHVDRTIKIIKEIAQEKKLSFQMEVIYADIDKNFLRKEFELGKIHTLDPGPKLKLEDINESTNIVAQMGLEPVMKAIENKSQVILCGRCYDPIAFGALAIKNGFDKGLALHMGKILECAAIAATPGSGRDCVLGTLTESSFILESMNPIRKFTKTSTAAHTLYEKSNPYILPGPGGILNLEKTQFTELDGGRVEVEGTQFIPSPQYQIKLEAAKKTGYRTVSIAGIRDEILIEQIDSVLKNIKLEVNNYHKTNDDYELTFHLYGKNGVMKELEPIKKTQSHELGIVIEVIGKTQDLANSICSYARSTLLHFGYPNRISTAGNLALLFSPSDIPSGPVYQFSIYHLLDVTNGYELFKNKILEIES